MIGWLDVSDSIMEDVPYSHKHFTGYGNLHFHAVFAPLDTLAV